MGGRQHPIAIGAAPFDPLAVGAIGSYRPTAHPSHRRDVQVTEFASVALIAENPLDARPRRQKTRGHAG